MVSDDEDIWHHYRADAEEALREIEGALLHLESEPHDKAEINRLYRGLHTLKGNSGVVGFVQIGRLAHGAEDLIGLVRDRGVRLDEEMVDLLLKVVDCLQHVVVEAARERKDASEAATQAITGEVLAALARHGKGHARVMPEEATSAVGELEADGAGFEAIDPSQDVGYLEIFLALVTADLPPLSEAAREVSEGKSEAVETVTRLLGEIGLASERMGYALLVALTERMSAAASAPQSAAWAASWADLELELYELVVGIEEQYRALAPEPQAFETAAIFRRACADLALADLAALMDQLAQPQSLREHEVAALFRRLRVACEQYELPGAAQACVDHADRLARFLVAGEACPPALLESVQEFAVQLGESINGVNAGDNPVDAVVPHLPDIETVVETTLPGLAMSTHVRRQMTPEGLELVSSAVGKGWTITEIKAELERTPALSEPLMAWIHEAGARLVTSAVVPPASRGAEARYHFLVVTPRPFGAVERDLLDMDPSGKELVAIHLGGAQREVATRRPEDAKPTDAPRAAPASSPADDDKELEESSSGESGKVEYLRIDARKVSLIMDLAGEIGLASSAVSHHPDLEGRDLEGFSSATHKLEMLIRELQTEVSGMRLVPVAGVFQRMRRVVRDACKRTGKKVALQLLGGETEIDKVMVESLHDPLVHLLRNAIDHGIEPPEERLRHGKPATGVLVLEASHQGGEVSVQVSDDGRGLDRDRILARARERGLVSPALSPTDEEIFDMIFLPGFSTKETIDELSGRGVGMDVVRTAVEALRGHVTLQTTPGRGTRFLLSLPLTLAFLEAMVVEEHDKLYAVPIERVFEVFRVEAHQLSRNVADGQTLVRVRERLVPVLWLHRYYGESARRGDGLDELGGRTVVIVQTSRGSLALPVDRLLGNQQVMLKPLKGVLSQVRAAAGYGMLRSGDVAVTLDCEQLHA